MNFEQWLERGGTEAAYTRRRGRECAHAEALVVDCLAAAGVADAVTLALNRHAPGAVALVRDRLLRLAIGPGGPPGTGCYGERGLDDETRTAFVRELGRRLEVPPSGIDFQEMLCRNVAGVVVEIDRFLDEHGLYVAVLGPELVS